MTPYLAAALIAILALLAIAEMEGRPARDRSEYAIRDDHRATEEARLAGWE
jgi:hypothetical protein